MDVPSDEAAGGLSIALLGMRAFMPRALFRLAVDQRVPVVVYVTGLNTQTGQRFLRIKPLPHFDRVEDLAAEVYAELQKIITEDAPAWHFWGIADRVFKGKASAPTVNNS